MNGKDDEPSGPPHQKDKSLPGHDIFCTPENTNFLSKAPYKTLDPTQREIRLLKVLPDSGSGFVECELLPSAPIAELRGKYLALSYCAGNPRNTEIIIVNGVECNVFANLCHALTCARHFWTTQPGDQDFLLWADQICINQADLSERSHQVGFMRDIYQSAQQTLICLSTSNAQGRGMEWLVEVSNKNRNWVERRMEPRDFSNSDFKRSAVVFWEEIFESPWWGRAWVFQEFIVSANATFLSGHHQIPWRIAAMTIDWFLGDGYPTDGCVYDRFRHTVQLSKLKLPDDSEDETDKLARKVWFMLTTKLQWQDTFGLTPLLARSRDSKASDDRDRIYAFLGLVDPGYGIAPDYSAGNTLCHVLTQTTRNIILYENNLSVLSELDNSHQARRPGLPSWVVDWTGGKAIAPFGAWDFRPSEDYRRRAGQAIASFRQTIHPETLQETTVMELTGIFVKKIRYLDRPYYGLPCTKDAILGERKGTVGPDGRGWTQVDHGLEAWYIYGLDHQIPLQREPYGYRVTPLSNTMQVGNWSESVPQDSKRRTISIF